MNEILALTGGTIRGGELKFLARLRLFERRRSGRANSLVGAKHDGPEMRQMNAVAKLRLLDFRILTSLR